MSDMQKMRDEFDAADRFASQLRRLNGTFVVDDDYPQVRHEYEGALAGLIKAMVENGRFEDGNRYGLERILVHDYDTARRGAPLGERR